MKQTGLPPIAWALAGLLGIAALLISLGQQDNDTKPEVASYSPSGISAFAELIRRNGVTVSVDQQPKPDLGPNDIAVAFEIQGNPETTSNAERSETRFHDSFWKFVSQGGAGILLPIQGDFLGASRAAMTSSLTEVNDIANGRTFKVSSSTLAIDPFTEPDGQDASVGMALWSAGQASFLRAYRIGKGTALVARDAIGVTNRFIDKADNARAYASLVSILAKPGKRVVFTEASFGNVHERGLLETIGPWANAAWQQLLFLGLVIVFTLGKRFGVPEEYRVTQRGSRELLDAIADVFRRAKSTQSALATSWDRADADLRLVLKLPKDASRAERDRLIPVSLQNALARLEAAKQMPKVPQDQALDLIRRAQYELDAFLGPHRAKLRSLAKLKA